MKCGSADNFVNARISTKTDANSEWAYKDIILLSLFLVYILPIFPHKYLQVQMNIFKQRFFHQVPTPLTIFNIFPSNIFASSFRITKSLNYSSHQTIVNALIRLSQGH